MMTRVNAQGLVEVLCCPNTLRPPGPRFPGDRSPVIPGDLVGCGSHRLVPDKGEPPLLDCLNCGMWIEGPQYGEWKLASDLPTRARQAAIRQETKRVHARDSNST
jgi:hypothetical protein